jgi:hypothetical protein
MCNRLLAPLARGLLTPGERLRRMPTSDLRTPKSDRGHTPLRQLIHSAAAGTMQLEKSGLICDPPRFILSQAAAASFCVV